MNVHWLEQSSSDLPGETNWLSANERARLQAMRIPKRRADWALGRWTAKIAIAAYLELPNDPSVLARIEVRPLPSGAPEPYLDSRPAPATISISHCAGKSICAVAEPKVELGVDIETVEPRSAVFVEDYFTAEENYFLSLCSSAERDVKITVLWSAKESALKALRMGLRLDMRSVTVDLMTGAHQQTTEISSPTGTWHQLRVRCVGDPIFDGWWRHEENLVRTLVAAPAPSRPVEIQTSELRATTALQV